MFPEFRKHGSSSELQKAGAVPHHELGDQEELMLALRRSPKSSVVCRNSPKKGS